MNYKAHVFGGLVFTLAFIIGALNIGGATFNWIQIVLFLLVSFVYSQLPDIDHQSSKIRWILTVVLLISSIYFIINNNLNLGLLSLILLLFLYLMKYIKFLKHRGFTHTFISALILSVPLIVIDFYAFIVGFVNYSAHLVLDKSNARRKN